ncbi:helix-turn-helix domain-containing protein [Oceaniglobus ichthyenteri]|uniref:helix-turn-helix domain-containing protein n=1 Tax=Oceaniglobus ichthyenteri TaxID=2136177 RepID=UPI000D389FF7|nr:helix-turn-helix transcriptional regulator [Oceaniglobus ichthyenteri]
MTLAQNTRRIRRERGMSQAALAEAAGVKQQLISQIERGVNTTTKKLPEIARALGCRVHDLEPNYRTDGSEDQAELLSKFNQILNGENEAQLQMLDDYFDFLLSKYRQPDDSNE